MRILIILDGVGKLERAGGVKAAMAPPPCPKVIQSASPLCSRLLVARVLAISFEVAHTKYLQCG